MLHWVTIQQLQCITQLKKVQNHLLTSAGLALLAALLGLPRILVSARKSESKTQMKTRLDMVSHGTTPSEICFNLLQPSMEHSKC